MSTHLCITVRWISDRFHGFIDGTESIEWPPSPFRLFQALVASANRQGMNEGRRNALSWIERQQWAPELCAESEPATGVLFDQWVPDNDNLVDHRKGSIRKFKPVLHGDRPVVHYVWMINPVDQPPVEELDDLAATLGWLGWAMDSAFASAKLLEFENARTETLQPNQLCRFQPVSKTTHTDRSLRVPTVGSMTELESLHQLNSIAFSDQTQRRKKKWPKTFSRFIYTTLDLPVPRPHAVFKLLDPNEDPARYPHAKLVHIAGMVRHLAIETMDKNAPPWISKNEKNDFVNRFIRGKRDPSASDEHKQISYVPLPSIGHEHADGIIRNVMLVAPIGMECELSYLAERIDGMSLKPEGEFEECESDSLPANTYRAELQLFKPPRGKFIAERYLGSSMDWHSVTPVILDGHNKKSKSDKPDAIARETEKLICKALQRAGIETPCSFTWRSLPFLKNTLSAHKYDRDGRHTGYHRPNHLKDLTAVHVRVTFKHPFPGPLTIGAGRHCGFGLMATVSD